MIVDLVAQRPRAGRALRHASSRGAPGRAAPRPLAPRHGRVTRACARARPTPDVVRAAFPPGSVTGAPKIQALKVIADARGHPARGLHGRDRLREPGRRPGAQRRDPDAGDERRARVDGLRRRDRGRLGPARRSCEEALGKAAPIAAALGRGRRRRPGAARAPPPHGAGAGRAGPTPRPACSRRSPCATAGPSTLDAHLARLAGERARAVRRSSCRRSSSRPRSPDGSACACSPDRARRARRRGRGSARRASRRPSRASSRARSPAASAAHKWLDRPQDAAWLDHSTSTRACSRRLGQRLDRGRAGVLVTPPADGRILPGVTRGGCWAPAHRDAARHRSRSPSSRRAAAIVLTSSSASPPPRASRRRRRRAAIDAGRRAAPRARSAVQKALLVHSLTRRHRPDCCA